MEAPSVVSDLEHMHDVWMDLKKHVRLNMKLFKKSDVPSSSFNIENTKSDNNGDDDDEYNDDDEEPEYRKFGSARKYQKIMFGHRAYWDTTMMMAMILMVTPRSRMMMRTIGNYV